MGASVSRSYMCCSMRDKNGLRDGFPLDRPPQFECVDVEVRLDNPHMIAFAPLHQREAANPRRVALASQTEVNVYRFQEGEQGPGEAPRMELTNVLRLDPGYCVSSILFCDEDNSRHLAVAIAPGNSSQEHVVRVWSCEVAMSNLPISDDSTPPAPPPSSRFVELPQAEGSVANLTEHGALVTRLACNKTYLLSADAAGECRLWQKNRAFARRGAATLHAGGVADLAMDRLFAYSAGSEDKRVCAWALPDLSPVLSIPIDIPEELFVNMGQRLDAVHMPALASDAPSPATSVPASPRQAPNRLARVNLLRRPLSRWAGWQGSSRGPKAPRGTLFAAGVLREGCEVAGAGAGVLMEWSLGEKPSCQSAQIAHDTPIVALVYGPYDNGPLISADTKGVFRVWEFLLERGLCFTQQIELACLTPGGGVPLPCLAVAVEQPRGLYVAAGAKRLYVWQRHPEASNGGLSRL